MRLPALAGTIERRLLINYRVDPEVATALLPEPFTPSLVGGYAIAGICLIQLRVRPPWLPAAVGLRSLNGAHRVAVNLPDGSEAVYVPRRDTNSRLNVLVGGRLFPGAQHHAAMSAHEDGDQLTINLASRDGSAQVNVSASIAHELPDTSVFDSTQHVSDFFERGSLGYSDTASGESFDGLELRTDNWSVVPVNVDHVASTFFDDRLMFPAGSAELDNALLMRNIHHTWHAQPQLKPTSPR